MNEDSSISKQDIEADESRDNVTELINESKDISFTLTSEKTDRSYKKDTNAQAAFLVPRHIWGLKSDCKHNIHWTEDNIVVYPAGNFVVVYSLDSKQQRFISSSECCHPDERISITSIELSPNKRLIAIAEKVRLDSKERAQISIWDIHTLKRRKLLNTPKITDFACMCFSPDSKDLLTLGSQSGLLINWNWEKMKMTQEISLFAQGTHVRVNECSFCPRNASLCIVLGNELLKLFQLESDCFTEQVLDFRGFSKANIPQNFLCHTWYQENVLVATEEGDILIFNQSILLSVIEDATGNLLPIYSLTSWSTGFACGCDQGILHLFDCYMQDGEFSFVKKKEIIFEENQDKITYISSNPSEDKLALSFDTQQAFQFSLINDTGIKPIVADFHSRSITGIDICIRKPLIVTCSHDRSLRVWNYLDGTLEINRTFPDEALSVAFHPSGLFLIAGFADRLRLFTLLVDDLHCFEEINIKNCYEVQYSHGGHYFACVNGINVYVINSYTCENVAILRGHTTNHKIRSIFWMIDDTSLVTAASGVDGVSYVFPVKDGVGRVQEHIEKGVSYRCALSSVDQTLYVVGSDRFLKEIRHDATIQNIIDAKSCLTQIVLSRPPQRMMFAGGESGTIISLAYPLIHESSDRIYFHAHSDAITRMRLSYHDNYLFSAGKDGILAVFEVKERDERIVRRLRQGQFIPWSDEILVTRADLDEKNQSERHMQSKVDELVSQNEYNLQLIDNEHKERLREEKEKQQIHLESIKRQLIKLQEQKQELEMQFEEQQKHLEEGHQKRRDDLITMNQHVIGSEMDKFHQLEDNMHHSMREHLDNIRKEEEQFQQNVESITEEYEIRIENDKAARIALEQEFRELVNGYKETKKQLEEDADCEIEHLKQKYQDQLQKRREETLKLKGSNGIMRKKCSDLRKNIEEQDEQMLTMIEETNHIQSEIVNLENILHGLQKEIEAKNQVIHQREMEIFELKKKNQELEKYKFVLDCDIKDLKSKIEPKEERVNTLKMQISDYDEALGQYHRESAYLRQTINDLNQQISHTQQDVQISRRKYSEIESKLKEFKNQLHEVVQYIHMPNELEKRIKNLHDHYVTCELQSNEIDPDVEKEITFQKDVLSTKVNNLKYQLAQTQARHKGENLKIMQDNVALVKEINELRKELKQLRTSQRESEMSQYQKISYEQIKKDNPIIYELKTKITDNKSKIQQLRTQLARDEDENANVLASNFFRPTSREIKLAPVSRQKSITSRPKSKPSSRNR